MGNLARPRPSSDLQFAGSPGRACAIRTGRDLLPLISGLQGLSLTPGRELLRRASYQFGQQHRLQLLRPAKTPPYWGRFSSGLPSWFPHIDKGRGVRSVPLAGVWATEQLIMPSREPSKCVSWGTGEPSSQRHRCGTCHGRGGPCACPVRGRQVSTRVGSPSCVSRLVGWPRY